MDNDIVLVSMVLGGILLLWGISVTFYFLRFRRKSAKANLSAGVSNFRELKESHLFLNSIIENIPDMIFVKDAKDLRFVRFNKAGEALIGRDQSEMLGKTDYDFFPKEQADAFTRSDRAVLDGKTAIEIAEEPLSTSKGVRLLNTKKIPLLNESGEPIYLLGISTDITEKKRVVRQSIKLAAEKAARSEAEKNAEHFQFLFDTMNILASTRSYHQTLSEFAKIVCSKLADGCLIDMREDGDEPKTLVFHHRDPEKLHATEEFIRRNRDTYKSIFPIMNVIRSREPKLFPVVSYEHMDQTFKNDEVQNWMKALNIRSAMIAPLVYFDKVIGAISFVLTETDRQFTIHDLNLAHDIANRASLLIEKVFLLESAQEANRAKNVFLANMSHEVRTPLGSILGFSELLLKSEALSDEYKSFARSIRRNGEQLLKIVDELLDISKIESERVNIERVDFSLYQVLDDVSMSMSQAAQNKGLKFYFEKSENLPNLIQSDPTRLQQILTNIIGNAVKFTREGAVRVYVRAEQNEPNEEYQLRFTIQDTGIGISGDQAKKLFQPFVQADNSISRQFGGTGLGLYLSKKLARALNGDVILEESRTGVGSTFIVTLTVKKSSSERKVFDRSSRRKSVLGQTKELDILIVDDNVENRLLLGQMLKTLGYKYDYAESGQEAIEKALYHSYDIIFMDIQMPHMNGFEAVSLLREHGYYKPVCALTAHAMKGDRELCFKKGFDAYLAKPVGLEMLRQTIEATEKLTHATL